MCDRWQACRDASIVPNISTAVKTTLADEARNNSSSSSSNNNNINVFTDNKTSLTRVGFIEQVGVVATL
jgi:hypothetical protein